MWPCFVHIHASRGWETESANEAEIGQIDIKQRIDRNRRISSCRLSTIIEIQFKNNTNVILFIHAKAFESYKPFWTHAKHYILVFYGKIKEITLLNVLH